MMSYPARPVVLFLNFLRRLLWHTRLSFVVVRLHSMNTSLVAALAGS